jgi:hypothetical protein
MGPFEANCLTDAQKFAEQLLAHMQAVMIHLDGYIIQTVTEVPYGE